MTAGTVSPVATLVVSVYDPDGVEPGTPAEGVVHYYGQPVARLARAGHAGWWWVTLAGDPGPRRLSTATELVAAESIEWAADGQPMLLVHPVPDPLTSGWGESR